MIGSILCHFERLWWCSLQMPINCKFLYLIWETDQLTFFTSFSSSRALYAFHIHCSVWSQRSFSPSLSFGMDVPLFSLDSKSSTTSSWYVFLIDNLSGCWIPTLQGWCTPVQLVFQGPVSKTGKNQGLNQTKTDLDWTMVLVFLIS